MEATKETGIITETLNLFEWLFYDFHSNSFEGNANLHGRPPYDFVPYGLLHKDVIFLKN